MLRWKKYSLYKVHPAYDVPDCNYIYIVRTTLLSVQKISNKKGTTVYKKCCVTLNSQEERKYWTKSFANF